MAYQPIKVIASAASADGHTNRVTDFDDNPLSNKMCYRDGLPYMTAVPNGQDTRGPRRVDLNGLFYLFSSNLFELQQGNFPTYNATIVGTGKPLPSGYPLGAVLWYPTGGYFVRSLVADNTESDLSNIDSWGKLTISAADLASGLSEKVDLASGVAQADVDYVIESYVNGTSWYRIYKSGWCEQGGLGVENTNIDLLKPYANLYYSVLITGTTDWNSYTRVENISDTSSFIFRCGGDAAGTSHAYWVARGYIAQGE